VDFIFYYLPQSRPRGVKEWYTITDSFWMLAAMQRDYGYGYDHTMPLILISASLEEHTVLRNTQPRGSIEHPPSDIERGRQAHQISNLA